jgi:hypothetical protein
MAAIQKAATDTYMRINHILTSLVSKILCCFGFLFFTGLPVDAQLCTGSLGDPVLNETFGKGSAASPLDAATTSYKYTAADCPNDGWYTLRNATNNCFNSWHTLTTDHTGDGQGNFMLVNASFEPSDFYLDTVKGLCANTVYEFSAWLMNVGQRFNQIKPNITFSIEKTDGTILSSISSGDIPLQTRPSGIIMASSFRYLPQLLMLYCACAITPRGGRQRYCFG